MCVCVCIHRALGGQIDVVCVSPALLSIPVANHDDKSDVLIDVAKQGRSDRRCQRAASGVL